MSKLIISLQGQKIRQEEIALLAHPNTAGVILFSRNFQNKEQLKSLVANIQHQAIKGGKKEGLPVFADQEGGHVCRFRVGFVSLPALEVFGQAYDIHKEVGLALAFEYGQKMARELVECGIISFAPVVDLGTGNPIISGLGRAFHQTPEGCVALASAYIEGMNKAGMLATVKHFPGHGRADIGDTHLIRCVDDRDKKTLIEQDLLVFRHLIQQNKVAAVMPAHIVYPKIDQDNTAGMSKIWLEQILRKELGFKGAIVSDCLVMQGAGNLSYLEKSKKALAFGDIAMLSNMTFEEFDEVLEGLNEIPVASQSAKRFSEWIKPSLERRLALAAEYRLEEPVKTHHKIDTADEGQVFSRPL